MVDARMLLNSVPKTLDSHPHKTYTDPGDRYYAGLDYGTFGTVTVAGEQMTRDTPSGKKELMSANNVLAATFGLSLSCAKGSYRGTAPHPGYAHGGPGVTDKPLTKPVWFSCRVDGAEGVDNFTAEAVGWTSRKTAWLVVAHDTSAARSLAAALRSAVR
jgi:hypothetical protein